MSSDASIVLSEQASDALCSIRSRKMLVSVARRIDLLSTFPRMGMPDETVPCVNPAAERRVSYVAHYAVRYRFEPAANVVYIDAITDERSDTPIRFL